MVYFPSTIRHVEGDPILKSVGSSRARRTGRCWLPPSYSGRPQTRGAVQEGQRREAVRGVESTPIIVPVQALRSVLMRLAREHLSIEELLPVPSGKRDVVGGAMLLCRETGQPQISTTASTRKHT